MRKILLAICFGVLSVAGAIAGPWDTPAQSFVQPGSDSCATQGTYWTPCPGRVPDGTIPQTMLPGYVLGGRLDAWIGAPDFLLRQEHRFWGSTGPLELDGNSPKLYVQGVYIGQKGDSVDLAMRRAGPNNNEANEYNTPGEALTGPTNIATIYAQAYGTTNVRGLSYYADQGLGRLGLILFRAEDAPTGTSRPGSILFGTAAPGQQDATASFKLNQYGQFTSIDTGSGALPKWGVPCHETICGMSGWTYGVRFTVLNPGTYNPVEGGGFRMPDNPGQVTLEVRRRNSDGTLGPMINVSYEGPDSCGAGKRCLTIPN